jgi:hypothetical protein
MFFQKHGLQFVFPKTRLFLDIGMKLFYKSGTNHSILTVFIHNKQDISSLWNHYEIHNSRCSHGSKFKTSVLTTKKGRIFFTKTSLLAFKEITAACPRIKRSHKYTVCVCWGGEGILITGRQSRQQTYTTTTGLRKCHYYAGVPMLNQEAIHCSVSDATAPWGQTSSLATTDR